MNQEIFRQLLNQYFSGELTSLEKVSLNEMINDPLYEDTLEAVIREMMLSDDYGEIDHPAIKARIDAWLDMRLQEETASQSSAGTAPITGRRIRLWSRVAAAAAILLLVSGSYYLVFNKPQKQIALTKEQHFKNDVLPGGNKAILTLAGGRQIILDSAADGTLTEQGNVQVQKLANGQLAYQRIDEKPTTVLYNTLTTPRGGQYQLTLPDGTEVWLNAASSITYPTAFVEKERVVKITGEAYFEVFKNASQPFKVSTNGNTEIEVLGTSFNINAYNDEKEVKTTLLEGSVRVAASNSLVGVNTNKDKLSVVLKPGQQAQIMPLVVSVNTKNEIRVVKDVDVDAVVAWKNGIFNFNQADLQTVMRQLSRWYDVEVVYEGDIQPRHFWGKIQRDLNLSEALGILKQTNVHFSIEGRRLIVKP